MTLENVVQPTAYLNIATVDKQSSVLLFILIFVNCLILDIVPCYNGHWLLVFSISLESS